MANGMGAAGAIPATAVILNVPSSGSYPGGTASGCEKSSPTYDCSGFCVGSAKALTVTASGMVALFAPARAATIVNEAVRVSPAFNAVVMFKVTPSGGA